MSQRLIRDGLIDSERYWNCSIEAQRLFWHIMLKADDVGCIQLAAVYVRRNLLSGCESNEKISSLIAELVENDLIRTYQGPNNGLFGFIPRFQQRLRTSRNKHPLPPPELTKDDIDATEKINEIKEKLENLSADCGHLSDICRPEVELEVEVELKASTNNLQHPSKYLNHAQEKIARGDARGSRLQKTWQLPKAWADWALAENTGLTAESVRKVADEFRDYWIAKSGTNATKLDWEATWRNWVRKIDKPNKSKKTDPPWWTSENLIDAKARDVGAWPARGGESWEQYKARISAKILEIENEPNG